MLTINEIFHSIQGESTHAGRPCVFVRLTACDLRCSWCDTPYAFTEGAKMSLDEVAARVDAYGCDLVEITGGEPLSQLKDTTVAARTSFGKGSVTVIGYGSRFTDPNMGVTGDVIPDAKLLELYDVEFTLLHRLVQ